MFNDSIFFIKPVLVGLLPSVVLWACIIPVALKLA